MTTFENKKKIAEKLIALGKTEFDKPSDEGGKLASDLKNYPHAYVVACILDRQVKAERAWKAPDVLEQRIGSFRFQKLKTLSISDWEKHLTTPPPSIPRYTKKMSVCLYEAVELIAKKYNGDASKIWKGNPPSGEIVCRFLEFNGVGQKIAAMATRILKEKNIPMSDYSTIDVAADVHVQRVFYRLGFISKKDKDMAIYTARTLQPEFPAILDYPTWEIGRKWCKPQKPDCKNCQINKICPKIGVH